ncbi:hypothetical protein D3C79_707590 [compost metagenome]
MIPLRLGRRHLQLGVRLLLLEVQIGEAVVDGGIHPPGQHQLKGLVEALGGYHLGPRRLGQLGEVAGQGLRGFLALQIREALDAVVVAVDHHHRLGGDIRV